MSADMCVMDICSLQGFKQGTCLLRFIFRDVYPVCILVVIF